MAAELWLLVDHGSVSWLLTLLFLRLDSNQISIVDYLLNGKETVLKWERCVRDSWVLTL